jgi:hypothetical protein
VTELLVEAQALQRAAGSRWTRRQLVGLIEALDDAGGLTAVLYDPRLGPAPIASTRIPIEYWRRGTRRELRRLADSSRPTYLVMTPLGQGGAPDTAILPWVRELARVVVLVCGAPSVDFADHAEPGAEARQQAHLVALRQADVLLTTSEALRSEVIRVLGVPPDAVVNVGTGVAPSPLRANSAPPIPWLVHREWPQITRPYVLHVNESGRCAPTLLEAWAGLPPDLRARNEFVIVSEDGECETEWGARAAELGAVASVKVLGRLSDDAIGLLRRGARACIAEGSTFAPPYPMLEATADQVPTFLARCGTNSADSAVGLLSSELSQLLTNASFAAAARVRAAEEGKRHAWPIVVDRLLEAVATHPALGGGSPRHRNRHAQLRIAIVGPFSSPLSSAASFNSHVAMSLAHDADVHCFVEDLPRAAEVGGATAFPIAILGQGIRPDQYDAMFFALANSPLHMRTYELLLRLGGIAWFHDARLGHLQWARAQTTRPNDPQRAMKDIMRSCYGDAFEPSTLEPGHRGQPWTTLGMVGEAVSAATAVVVSSAQAATMLSVDTIDLAREVWIVPAASPAARVGSVVARATESSSIMVVSTGTNDAEVGVVADAVATLPRSDRPMVIVATVAQPAQPARPIEERLGRTISTGTVIWRTAEYWHRLASAMIVVVLGEAGQSLTEAATADAMALGRPIIANQPISGDVPVDAYVRALTSSSGDDIGAQIRRLLGDRHLRDRLGRAAAAHSSSWTFAHVARRTLEFVTSEH